MKDQPKRAMVKQSLKAERKSQEASTFDRASHRVGEKPRLRDSLVQSQYHSKDVGLFPHADGAAGLSRDSHTPVRDASGRVGGDPGQIDRGSGPGTRAAACQPSHDRLRRVGRTPMVVVGDDGEGGKTSDPVEPRPGGLVERVGARGPPLERGNWPTAA